MSWPHLKKFSFVLRWALKFPFYFCRPNGWKFFLKLFQMDRHIKRPHLRISSLLRKATVWWNIFIKNKTSEFLKRVGNEHLYSGLHFLIFVDLILNAYLCNISNKKKEQISNKNKKSYLTWPFLWTPCCIGCGNWSYWRCDIVIVTTNCHSCNVVIVTFLN